MYEQEVEFASKAALAASSLLRDGFHARFPRELEDADYITPRPVTR
jgi:hypothetical protein